MMYVLFSHFFSSHLLKIIFSTVFNCRPTKKKKCKLHIGDGSFLTCEDWGGGGHAGFTIHSPCASSTFLGQDQSTVAE